MASANCPPGLLYHPEHDWARVDGDEATYMSFAGRSKPIENGRQSPVWSQPGSGIVVAAAGSTGGEPASGRR